MKKSKDRRAVGRWCLVFGALVGLCAMGGQPVRATAAPTDLSRVAAAPLHPVPVEDRFIVRFLPAPSYYMSAYALSDSNLVTGLVVKSDEALDAVPYRLSLNGSLQMEYGSLPTGSTYCPAYAINSTGAVVGKIDVPSGSDFPFYEAFLWEPTHPIQPLGSLGEVIDGTATDVDETGTVVGWTSVATVDDFFYTYRAFVRPPGWTGPGPGREVGTLGGDYAYISAINERGVVVGASTPPDDGFFIEQHAFRHSGNGVLSPADDLDSPGGNSYANDINDAGTVIGASLIPETGEWQPFRHVGPGKFQAGDKLPKLGDFYPNLYKINNLEQIVGYTSTSGNPLNDVATVWDPVNGTRNLNDLVTSLPDGVWLGYAQSINNAGLIVGDSYVDLGFEFPGRQGFVAAPLPVGWLEHLHTRITQIKKLPERKKLLSYLGAALREARAAKADVDAARDSRAIAKLKDARKELAQFAMLVTKLRFLREVPAATATPLLDDTTLVARQLTNAVTVLRIPKQ